MTLFPISSPVFVPDVLQQKKSTENGGGRADTSLGAPGKTVNWNFSMISIQLPWISSPRLEFFHTHGGFLQAKREGKNPMEKNPWKKDIPAWFGVFVVGNQPDFGGKQTNGGEKLWKASILGIKWSVVLNFDDLG